MSEALRTVITCDNRNNDGNQVLNDSEEINAKGNGYLKGIVDLCGL